MSVILQEKYPEKVRYYYLAFFIGLTILGFDQLSKYLTYYYLNPVSSYHYIYPYGGIGIFKNFLGIEFSLNYMANTGAAWGILGDYQVPLLILRIGLIGGLLVYFFKSDSSPLFRLPLALITAGAIGNVLDYFIYGHVIDMFHFVLWGYDFPVFNVADSAIAIGIGLMILFTWIID